MKYKWVNRIHRNGIGNNINNPNIFQNRSSAGLQSFGAGKGLYCPFPKFFLNVEGHFVEVSAQVLKRYKIVLTAYD